MALSWSLVWIRVLARIISVNVSVDGMVCVDGIVDTWYFATKL